MPIAMKSGTYQGSTAYYERRQGMNAKEMETGNLVMEAVRLDMLQKDEKWKLDTVKRS